MPVGPQRDLRLVVVIGLGGAAGTLARFALTRLFPFAGHGWPWATFVANVAGTLFLGYVVTRPQGRLPALTYHRPLLATGFCGALTTFSTFNIELLKLARNGHAALAIGYAGVSIAIGLAGVFAISAHARRSVLTG